MLTGLVVDAIVVNIGVIDAGVVDAGVVDAGGGRSLDGWVASMFVESLKFEV